MTDKTCREVDVTRIWITMTKHDESGRHGREMVLRLTNYIERACIGEVLRKGWMGDHPASCLRDSYI